MKNGTAKVLALGENEVVGLADDAALLVFMAELAEEMKAGVRRLEMGIVQAVPVRQILGVHAVGGGWKVVIHGDELRVQRVAHGGPPPGLMAPRG